MQKWVSLANDQRPKGKEPRIIASPCPVWDMEMKHLDLLESEMRKEVTDLGTWI